MAGSWGHIVDDEGKFIGAELLDNTGDVQEALLECYGMVWYLADALSEQSGMGAFTKAQLIDEAHERYTEGLRVSPTIEGD